MVLGTGPLACGEGGAGDPKIRVVGGIPKTLLFRGHPGEAPGDHLGTQQTLLATPRWHLR